jgi:hypothetical protein
VTSVREVTVPEISIVAVAIAPEPVPPAESVMVTVGGVV